MMLEGTEGLPAAWHSSAGVQALLEVLGQSDQPISLGRVCGSRLSAVWLGEGLEVVSLTLEPHELHDASTVRQRAEAFLAEIHSLAQ